MLMLLLTPDTYTLFVGFVTLFMTSIAAIANARKTFVEFLALVSMNGMLKLSANS